MEKHEKKSLLLRLGAWIVKLRKSKGLGQDRLTEEAGLAKGTVSKIENGRVDVKITTLASLAKALQVPLAKVTGIQV